MSDQPEALRLADALTEAAGDYWQFHKSIGYGAAAELRRLAAVEAQRDALKQTLHDELAGNLRLRDLGGARPDEPMLTFLERIIAERDALLEALKSTGLFLHHCWCDVQMNDYSFERLNRQMAIVDFAIKAVEGEGA